MSSRVKKIKFDRPVPVTVKGIQHLTDQVAMTRVAGATRINPITDDGHPLNGAPKIPDENLKDFILELLETYKALNNQTPPEEWEGYIE